MLPYIITITILLFQTTFFYYYFLILIGLTVSDFGELEVPLTDTENHNYVTSGTTVKNALECGTLAHKVSQKIPISLLHLLGGKNYL